MFCRKSGAFLRFASAILVATAWLAPEGHAQTPLECYLKRLGARAPAAGAAPLFDPDRAGALARLRSDRESRPNLADRIRRNQHTYLLNQMHKHPEAAMRTYLSEFRSRVAEVFPPGSASEDVREAHRRLSGLAETAQSP